MKKGIASITLIILTSLLTFGVSGCRTTPTPVENSPSAANASTNILTRVLMEKENAGLNCARILIDNGELASVSLHSGPYVGLLKKIEVASCPKDFQIAWAAYIATWEQKRKQEQATEDTLDAISMWKGEFSDLPATVHSLEAYDTKAAWQNCERIALADGADVTK